MEKSGIKRCTKEAFAVIGKAGSTDEGDGFIQRLWKEANGHFEEVAHLAKKGEKGDVAGVWGAMSDRTRSFLPWEKDFTEGLYLAGVECGTDAEAPEGWTKWIIPGFEYLYTVREGDGTFSEMMDYLQKNGMELAGAVQEFSCPETGKEYLFFPIRRL
ncbi:MAG: GyrI-like domain-containing protein [Acetatifactor sp.]|nr:GyrI-like domain-containing protein [Acetatifactor sp.]